MTIEQGVSVVVLQQSRGVRPIEYLIYVADEGLLESTLKIPMMNACINERAVYNLQKSILLTDLENSSCVYFYLRTARFAGKWQYFV